MGYSKDFKDKVIEIMIRDEMSVRKAAQHFNICIQTIQNWKKSTTNKPIPGRPAKISREQILKDVEQYPDDYQYERAARFGCGTSTIGDALKRLNIVKSL